MIRRLVAFALAFVTLGAPLVGAMCQARCAWHEMDATAGHGRHHSCPPSAPSAGAVMNAVPHACGHTSDETIAMSQALRELAAPAVIAVQASTLPEIDTIARFARTTRLEESPPGLLPLSTQLRV